MTYRTTKVYDKCHVRHFQRTWKVKNVYPAIIFNVIDLQLEASTLDNQVAIKNTPENLTRCIEHKHYTRATWIIVLSFFNIKFLMCKRKENKSTLISFRDKSKPFNYKNIDCDQIHSTIASRDQSRPHSFWGENLCAIIFWLLAKHDVTYA